MGFPKPLPTQSMKNLFHSPIANRGGLSARLQTPWFVLLACVCLLAAPEGIATFTEAHPDVPVFAGAIDRELDGHGYIRPGLGDAGDRFYGTR